MGLEPSHFQVRLGPGQALLEPGDRKEAEAHLEAAKRLSPLDPRPDRALERLRRKETGKDGRAGPGGA